MESRTINTIRNSSVGMMCQLLSVLLSFVTRTYFIQYLGTQYLGYAALFVNVISVLSIADLGITTSLTYGLYKPIHDHDMERVVCIIEFFRKIFIVIGCLLLICSVVFSPYASFFINEEVVNNEYVSVIFLIYAVNSFTTYFFVDMRTLLIADQKEYIVSLIDCISKIVIKVIQIISLKEVGNYILFLSIECVSGILFNIYLSMMVRKKYALKNFRNMKSLKKSEKRAFFSSTIYISLYKVASVGINSTDSLFISKLIGTTVLGVYSNYSLIIETGYGLINKLVVGVTASLGNLFAGQDKEKEQKIIYDLQFIDAILSSIVFIFPELFVGEVVELWLGKEMCLPRYIILVVCVNQYLYMVRKTPEIIMQTQGKFKEIVPIKIGEMLLNIVLSILFIRYWGFVGVFLGTTISMSISSLLVIKKVVDCMLGYNYWKYLENQIKYFFGMVFVYICIKYTISVIVVKGICGLLWRVFVAIVVFILINFIIFKKNIHFESLMKYINKVLHMKKIK